MILAVILVLFLIVWGITDRQEARLAEAETPVEAAESGGKAIAGTLLLIALCAVGAFVLLGAAIGTVKP